VKVIGVRLSSGQVITAPIIVSAEGARESYINLLSAENLEASKAGLRQDLVKKCRQVLK
jgi:flavin-dependent dehydrogenase